MTHDPKDAQADDAFGAALRAADRVPEVPPALMRRVLDDAASLQAARAGAAMARPAAQPACGFWALVRQALGNGGMAGLAAAGLAGIWIGFAQPADLPFLPAMVELIPADDDLWHLLDAEFEVES